MPTTALIVLSISLCLKASVVEGGENHTYVIFEDDFEDGEVGDWDIPDWFLRSPTVELDDGNYVLCTRGDTGAESGDCSWTDYTVEVKVKFVYNTGAHISFRRSPLGKMYTFRFFYNELTLDKNYPEKWMRLYECKRFPIDENKWYTVKIVCIGRSIKIYIDDVLRIDYVDEEEDPNLSGRIMLCGQPDAVIFFDDVRVSTTHRLYVYDLIKEAQDEIDEAKMVDAETGEAEQMLAEARAAFEEGSLSSAESLAKEALNLAEHAPVGLVPVEKLLKYFAEYDQHIIEVYGTIRDIRYEEGVYRFAVDDGTGVVSATYNGSLGEIKTDDKVRILGVFDASTMTVMAESLERMREPMEGLYTFLLFKDDFEDGDFSDWRTWVSLEVEGSEWNVKMEGDNHIFSGFGDCWGETGDPEWTDYIFELKIKLIKGDAGITFRTIPKPPYGAERYIVMLYSSGMGSLVKTEIYLEEERWNELKQIDFGIKPGEWHMVRIICHENNIKVYINDNLKLDYTDEENPILSGFIGVGVSYQFDYKPSHSYFDDIKVYKIATTSDISELIAYAQSEIERAREVNADTSAAEFKLEQAKEALAQEEYKMVQYLVDEAVWLAKRSSVGEISIKKLRALATKISGHTVTITGLVRDLVARYGVGYDFDLEDGTGRISVRYQGALMDIGNDYKVKVIGVFDAPTETVTASRIEKISGPSTPAPAVPTGPLGITLSIEQITMLISIGGAVVGAGGWVVRHHGMEKKRKILFRKLMDEIDGIYSRFKMNSRLCETELLKIRDRVLDEFKEGVIDEDKYKILDKRIDDYMKEIKEQIEQDKT